ncbi:MAG: hypothetical protein JRI25_00625 [Deltaproteobacteria bacterium]|nr:hypothetical protein [Deltaproteobacteria bacterium]MBW2253081.1 hypothetical protein [Deltaproteobacteria bacterium]
MRREAEGQQRLAEGRQERERLFDDLTSLGEAMGHVAVQRHDGGVTFRFSDRFLHFEPMGEGDRVRVTFDGIGEDEHRLYQESGLGNRWVWSLRRRGREDRLPLFDAGLEELLVLTLKLPHPNEIETHVVPGPTLDDAVPARQVEYQPPKEEADPPEPDDTLSDERKRTL